MTTTSTLARYPALDRRFEAIVFDWDGTAVPDRSADATDVRALVEALVATGAYVAVVSGTHVGNVDGQLRARPTGPGRLVLALNRGSEVFDVGPGGPDVAHRRVATPEEEAALDAAAQATVAALASRGLHAEIVSQRLNRRKIDLIPEPEWADPPKAIIDRLLAAVEARLAGAGIAGLPEVVEIAEAAARDAGLPRPKVTSDAKHVEIGLTDKTDSIDWILADCWSRGIGAGLVLIAGDEMGPLGGLPGSDSLMLSPGARRAQALSVGVEPTGVPPGVLSVGGGPAAFRAILGDQLRRRTELHVPPVDETENWTLVVDGYDPGREPREASLLTLADGHIGSSGSPLGSHPDIERWVVAAGAYDVDGPDTQLLRAPAWQQLDHALRISDRLRRVLDLRGGLLHERHHTAAGPVTSLRFSSLARPGTVALRASGPTSGSGGSREAVVRGANSSIALATRVETDDAGLERLGAYAVAPDGDVTVEDAEAHLAVAAAAGYETLLAEQRLAWARRWDSADIELDDHDLQLATRAALFHLMGSARSDGEAAVGARGLTGPAYRGHVFWDADVFTLPFLAATEPGAARAMLEYRVRRLPAALATAAAEGHAGARFPWESARTGEDVTPRSVRDAHGNLVPIRTGQLEAHIVADIAWAATQYVEWTGDEAFARGPGCELVLATARYWASRVRLEAGRGHLYGVIGPDEYHEPVDDNAYTNVMARWNLREAARLADEHPGAGVEPAERRRWLQLADALVDGYDPETGLYEEFAGFAQLEPLVIAEMAPRRPIPADMLLGRDRVESAQVVKQADVLMLHHLVPDEVVPGSLEANFDYYEPRTAHGSSLSPGIHAALLARLGRLEPAVDLLRIAARVDLDDVTATSNGGLHLATYGSVWQALVFGFAGIRPIRGAGGVLKIDPRLPKGWKSLVVRLRFRQTRARIHLGHEGIGVTTDGPIVVEVAGRRHSLSEAGSLDLDG